MDWCFCYKIAYRAFLALLSQEKFTNNCKKFSKQIRAMENHSTSKTISISLKNAPSNRPAWLWCILDREIQNWTSPNMLGVHTSTSMHGECLINIDQYLLHFLFRGRLHPNFLPRHCNSLIEKVILLSILQKVYYIIISWDLPLETRSD